MDREGDILEEEVRHQRRRRPVRVVRHLPQVTPQYGAPPTKPLMKEGALKPTLNPEPQTVTRKVTVEPQKPSGGGLSGYALGLRVEGGFQGQGFVPLASTTTCGRIRGLAVYHCSLGAVSGFFRGHHHQLVSGFGFPTTLIFLG